MGKGWIAGAWVTRGRVFSILTEYPAGWFGFEGIPVRVKQPNSAPQSRAVKLAEKLNSNFVQKYYQNSNAILASFLLGGKKAFGFQATILPY